MARHVKYIWQGFINEITSDFCYKEHKDLDIHMWVFLLPGLCLIFKQVLHVRLFQPTQLLPSNVVFSRCLWDLQAESKFPPTRLKSIPFGPCKTAFPRSVMYFT